MGKKSPTPPPAPDYAAAAREQGAANIEAARLQARLANPNISGPLGGQRVTYGRETFNQAGYDQAMAEYQKQLEAYNAAKAGGQTYTPQGADYDYGSYDVETGQFRPGRGMVRGTTVDASGMPVAPTREQFTTRTDLDTPFIEQYLTPEAQATLEAQQRVERALAGLGEQAIGTVRDVYGQKFTPTGLPEQRFGFDYGQLPTAPDLAAMGRARADVQAGQIAAGPTAEQYGLAAGGPAAPGQIVGADLFGLGGVGYGPAEGQYGYARGFVPTERLQQGVDTRGLANLPVSAGMTGQQAILSRLLPQLEQERAGIENRLRNQGLTPGTEAYDREMALVNQRANDLLQQTAAQGLSLDAQMRAQGFSERQIQAELANQARLGQFGMGMQQAGLYNQALQQNLAQGLSVQEARNRAQAQDLQQRLALGEFGRQGQQLAFQMGQSASEAQNRAIAQNFQQALAATEAARTGEQMRFGQQMDLAGLYNAALAQNQQAALQQAQAQAALQAQGFNQAQAAAAFQNAQRQAALQEQLAMRQLPLNEISALMSGAQIQLPQFQAYQGADVAAAPLFNATQAAGQFAQQNYANQVGAYNAKMGLLGGLATGIGMAASGPAGLSGFFTGSDRRLKSNIVRVGTHPLGIGIYEYDIAGQRQRGVMADEVETVLPEAVVTRSDGYKMVNYGML